MSEVIQYKKKDMVAHIKITKPRFNREMIYTLRDVWIDFEKDDSLRVAVLTGEGKYFCIGADLDQILDNTITFEELTLAIPGRGLTVSKPIIAALNGYTIGGGLGLAGACDIRIAAQSAQFAFPEAKLGIVMGGMDLFNCFDRNIILEMMLTGDKMDAVTVQQAGFLNKIVPDDLLMEEAQKYADKIKNNAPLSVRAIKAFSAAHNKSIMEEWRLLQHTYITPQLNSNDLQEGIKAFKEKRPASFEGK